MAETDNGATPAAPAAPATPPSAPAANPPATPPAAPAPAAGDEPKVEDGYVKVPLAKWEQTNRDAARYRSKKTGNQPTADERRDARYNQPDDGGDPDERVTKLQSELTTTQKENLQLKLQNSVRDLLEKDDYKDVPEAVKRILRRNPLAVVDPRAKDLTDALADIEDYLTDELENSGTGSAPTVPGQPVETPPTSPETPPVNGSTPAPTGAGAEESTEGKTGQARSVTVLKNIFKRGPTPKQ